MHQPTNLTAHERGIYVNWFPVDVGLPTFDAIDATDSDVRPGGTHPDGGQDANPAN